MNTKSDSCKSSSARAWFAEGAKPRQEGRFGLGVVVGGPMDRGTQGKFEKSRSENSSSRGAQCDHASHPAHSPVRDAMPDKPDISARPLLIGGMHRSGTSLTASMFADAGLNIGTTLLGASPSNPMGHFEDVGFFNFHRRALVGQGLCSEGYTATVRGVVPAAFDAEASGLVTARTRPGVAWGWKEPRTTLFLDFWQDRIPDARHVFVFRRPWEVADSLFRRGDDTFAINPVFALEVWAHYNRLILDFVHQHSDRCVVFEILQVIADPCAVVAAVRERLDIPLTAPHQCYVDSLFSRDDASTRARLVQAMAPEAWRTYLELRDLAGSDGDIDTRQRDRSLGECSVLEWARASRAEALAREAECRIRAEVDERVRRAAAERRRKWSPANVVRRAATKLLAGLAAAARCLSQPERDASDDAPRLLPFPRAGEGPAAKRAA